MNTAMNTPVSTTMSMNARITRSRKLVPVAAALALVTVEAGRTVAVRGLATEVEVTSKRLGTDPLFGTAYLVTVTEEDGTTHEMPVSQTAWEWLRLGGRLPARTSLGGRLVTVEMRYER